MRYLIVANRTLGGDRLVREIEWRATEQVDASFYVLVPVSPLTDEEREFVETEGIGSDAGETLEVSLARWRLQQELHRLRDVEVEATGDVGDANPVEAVANVLDQRGFDEIIVSTLSSGLSRWLKMDLPHRLERRFGLPVMHVEAPKRAA